MSQLGWLAARGETRQAVPLPIRTVTNETLLVPADALSRSRAAISIWDDGSQRRLLCIRSGPAASRLAAALVTSYSTRPTVWIDRWPGSAGRSSPSSEVATISVVGVVFHTRTLGLSSNDLVEDGVLDRLILRLVAVGLGGPLDPGRAVPLVPLVHPPNVPSAARRGA